ncbi:hypothetical protein BH24ACI1_BH24ACI1_03280 [soil metagenome]
MKNLFWLILLISLYASAAFAQCEKEPTIERTGKIIHAKEFSIPSRTNFASKMLFKMIGALTEGRENEMFLDYLYAEIYSEPKATAIALEAKTSGGEKFSSDLGNAALRVSRNGFVRIAMRLPKDSAANFPAAVTVACYTASNEGSTRDGSCRNLQLIKLVRLDQNYLPVTRKLESPPQNVKVGEKAVFLLSHRKQAI